MPSLASFAARGPFAVGLRTAEVADPDDPGRALPVDLWYPAADGVDDAAAAAPHPFGQPHRAVEDAPPRDTPSPLVVFSHGNSGVRRQSTFLTTHLASHGIAVVAPDHAGNTFPEMAALRSEDERVRVHRAARAARPRDAIAAVDAALAGRLGAVALDAARIGALGHSFGGWTATKLPRLDARVRAVCALAPASEPFVGRRAYEPGELPFARPIPTLVIAAVEDVLVDLATSIGPLWARLGAPKALVGFEGADHFHFCDGIELLHALHERTPRPAATRTARPLAETLAPARAQRLVAALVAHFLWHGLGLDAAPGARGALVDADELAALDPAARRLGAE
ncbi:MAG: dienelactone hydrolase family protein [Myxococcota bacterium]